MKHFKMFLKIHKTFKEEMLYKENVYGRQTDWRTTDDDKSQ